MNVRVSVSRRIPKLLHEPGCNLGSVGIPSSCALWADLQSVHGFRCHDNIARTRLREMSASAYTLSMPGLFRYAVK